MKIIEELERLAKELQVKRDEIQPTLGRPQRWGFDTGYRLNQIEELLESMPDPQVILALCEVARAARALRSSLAKLDSLTK